MLLAPIDRLPMMDNVPVISPPVIPGEIVPLLPRELPVPTLIVPTPAKVPVIELENPPAFENVAPAATSMRPDWVSAPATASVPLLTLTMPVLLRLVIVCAVAVVLVSVPALLKVPPAPVIGVDQVPDSVMTPVARLLNCPPDAPLKLVPKFPPISMLPLLFNIAFVPM